MPVRTYSISLSPTIYEQEVECIVHFTYVRGTPERGPSYASGGEPAEGPEIEVARVEVEHKDKWVDAGDWFADLIQAAIVSGEIDSDQFDEVVNDTIAEERADARRED